MPKKLNLIGQRFGTLVVKEEFGRDQQGHTTWLCKCDCNENEIVVCGDNLRSGNTKSCGCLHREVASNVNTKHGQNTNKGRSCTYNSWVAMKNRCENPNNSEYPNYGGRGVTVCERWQNFENFYADVGDRPEGKTLDRKNNDGHYEPGNWQWSTQQEQAQNRRSKGYCWDAKLQKWKAQITVTHKQIHLGFFTYEEDARQAYIEAKKKYHGIYLNG